MAYDPAKGEIFVARYDGNVSIVSDSSNSIVATIPIGSPYHGNNLLSAVYDSGKGEIFFTNINNGTVSVISDSSDSVVATIPVGPNPRGIAYDPTRNEVFVTTKTGVDVISDATNAVTATIPIGGWGYDITFDAGKDEMFVPNNFSLISVITDSNDTVVATIHLSNNNSNVTNITSNGVYDPGKGELFFQNGDYWVSTISDSNDSVMATIGVGYGPGPMAYDPAGYVFVVNSEESSMSVISDSTNKVLATVDIGSRCEGIAYDSVKNEIFVSSEFSPILTVLSVAAIGGSSSTVPEFPVASMAVVTFAILAVVASVTRIPRRFKPREAT